MAGPASQTQVIVDVFLEAIVYGLSASLFPLALFVLCRKRSFREINRTMFSVTWLLFALSTTHLGIKLQRFIHWSAHNHDVDFHGISPDNAALGIIYALQTLLGDAVVIYRCYAVWQRTSIILLPIATWLALLAASIAVTTIVLQNNTSTLFFGRGEMLLNSFYAFSLITNFLSAGLLAYRIWMVNREASKSRKLIMKSRIYPIMIISLDAGLLYSATLLASLIVFARKLPVFFLICDLLVPIIALTFYMVIIRVGLILSKHAIMFISNDTSCVTREYTTGVDLDTPTPSQPSTSIPGDHSPNIV